MDDIVLAASILGAAAVFGGFFHQRNEKSKNVTSGMFYGAMVYLAAWILKIVLGFSDINWGDSHFIVYAIIAIVMGVLAWQFRGAKGSRVMVWWAMGILSALALVLSIFW